MIDMTDRELIENTVESMISAANGGDEVEHQDYSPGGGSLLRKWYDRVALRSREIDDGGLWDAIWDAYGKAKLRSHP